MKQKFVLEKLILPYVVTYAETMCNVTEINGKYILRIETVAN